MSERKRRLLEPASINVGANTYRGQFGFRNRRTRTGVDPWDTEMEWAHAQGLFLRRLLTGSLFTRHPLGLAMMLIGAVACLMPALTTVFELVSGDRLSLAYDMFYTGQVNWMSMGIALGCMLTCFTLPGVLLLYNFASSILQLSTPEKPRARRRRKPEADQSSQE